ncbi:hypothetical protein FA15DRAFT_636827 [Coprinopsis marcescibilis]|uniref:ATP synthase F(0) complex subunit e, mitochondrial n=1 Tax=Coprinopsis marcescibilis TaxID=230819 RepID=A0A5C3L1Z0_COPMA|nr:hypothetical protein FA15DRAFT_636827 [Coprinopsis marcescibilis]
MVSSTVNVVRYSALLTGVVYGWYHRRTLQADADHHKVQNALHHQEKLVAEARAAWKRKQEAGGDNVVTDPEDPRFDLEKLVASWDKRS